MERWHISARQLRAVELLKYLLQRAVIEQLPAVNWLVLESGGLLGECLQSDPDARRSAFDAWTQALEATAAPEYVARSGVTWLHSSVTVRLKGRFPIAVGMRADIWQLPTDDQSGEHGTPR